MRIIDLIAAKLYWRLFHEEAPLKFYELVHNFAYTFTGLSGATLITMGFNILAVRALGPEEFGKVNLVVSLGELMAIPMLWGLATAVLRHLGAEPQKQKPIMGTSFWIVTLLVILFSTIFNFSARGISSVSKIPTIFLTFAIVYAGTTTFFYLFQSYFQGLLKFKLLSRLCVLSAIIFAVSISFSIFYLKNTTWGTLLWANLARFFIIIIAGLAIFRSALTAYENKTAKQLSHYGSYQMLSVLAGFFSLGTIDNIMINYFLGPVAVGLYAAYYLAFNVVVSKILMGVTQVFLPTAAGLDASLLYAKIKRLFWKTGWSIALVIFFLIWALFRLYGPMYPFDWRLAILMALSTTLYFFLTMFGTIIASVGVRGVRLGVVFAITSAAINIILNIILIPRFHLFGVVIATICATTTVLGLATYVLKKQKNHP